MIPNKEKEGWHCLAVKNLPALLRGITSKYHGGFCYLNCLHFFRTENKLKSHKKVCINKDFCGTVMPSEKDKILAFKHYMRSDKMPYIIYADIESLIKKRDEYENEKTFKNKNRWGHSLWIFNVNNWGFDHIEDKHTLFCPKDCMKMFCESLREHTKKIVDFEKNVTADKKRIRITQIYRKILPFQNKIL